MAKDQIQISIPASYYSKLRAALCRVGCGNTPNTEEAALLHDLMKNLDSARGQLLSGTLLDGVVPEVQWSPRSRQMRCADRWIRCWGGLLALAGSIHPVDLDQALWGLDRGKNSLINGESSETPSAWTKHAIWSMHTFTLCWRHLWWSMAPYNLLQWRTKLDISTNVLKRLKTSPASPSMGSVQSRFVTVPLSSYHCWSRKARATDGFTPQGAWVNPLGEYLADAMQGDCHTFDFSVPYWWYQWISRSCCWYWLNLFLIVLNIFLDIISGSFVVLSFFRLHVYI